MTNKTGKYLDPTGKKVSETLWGPSENYMRTVAWFGVLATLFIYGKYVWLICIVTNI